MFSAALEMSQVQSPAQTVMAHTELMWRNAPARPQWVRHGELRYEERCPQIGREDTVEVFGWPFVERHSFGRVDPHVEAAKIRRSPLDDRCGCLCIRDVTGHRYGQAAHRIDLLDRAADPCGIPAADCDGGPSRAKQMAIARPIRWTLP
jgi:hypothetical protein